MRKLDDFDGDGDVGLFLLALPDIVIVGAEGGFILIERVLF